MNRHNEADFYMDNGWPTESFSYCSYVFPKGIDPEWGEDYDQFVLVTNALYPYIRLTRKRGQCQSPCGGSSTIGSESSYARLTDEERNEECPKIAWGLAAEFLAHLRYDSNQKDYVALKSQESLYSDYYAKYWEIYKSNHNGLKFSNVSTEQKELAFLIEHLEIIKKLWDKSEPLKEYPVLYGYACSIEKDYVSYLLGKKQTLERKLMPRNNSFSTELKEIYGKPYVKVYFLDDSVAPTAQTIVSALNCVMKANVTESKSMAHPGNTLTVYPKPMVDGKNCEKEVKDALNNLFSNVTVGRMNGHNEAYFKDIERRILDTLDKAEATIIVCVAWFTNPRLRDKLLEKNNEGVDVRVIIFKDGINHTKGIDLTGLRYKEYRGERGGYMHDKFCVIDNVHTISGSYNWTLSAENKNDEDASFQFEDYKFASKFTKRFNEIWKRDGNDK